jgi:L-ascorbate metabolism protein UlaG (beta-lactamase superfamily)
MKIRWNGHSSFTVTTDAGLVIVLDPYEPGGFGGGIAYGPVDARPDIVTISHDHGDHNYIANFKNPFQKMTGPGEAKGVKFRTVPTYHDGARGAQRGANQVFVFTVDGVTICHLGDLGHPLTAETVAEIGPIDVLLLPVGGFYTIDHLQAADVMEKLNPRIVIPMHYKTDKCKFPITDVSPFTAGKKNVKKLDADEIEVSAAKLPAAREILVLRHHC